METGKRQQGGGWVHTGTWCEQSSEKEMQSVCRKETSWTRSEGLHWGRQMGSEIRGGTQTVKAFNWSLDSTSGQLRVHEGFLKGQFLF